jgi:PEP-CTERM motif
MLARDCWLEFFNRKGINMHYASVTKKSLFSAALCALLAAAPAIATIYDEAGSGDLSNSQAAPTALTLTPGSNSVIGTVNGFDNGDGQDWVSFTIPTGFVMTSYVNSKYDSTDDQGFTGFQFGPSFLGDPFVAGSYAGYAHFGFAATNPDGTPPKSTVGVNLLPLMANPSFAPGTTGFTPPLHAGTYTFLIQQGNPVTTNYQFDMNVRSVSVPEPGSSLCLLFMGGLAILALRRRLGYLDQRIR